MLPQAHSWLGEGWKGIPFLGEGDPSPFLTPSRLMSFGTEVRSSPQSMAAVDATVLNRKVKPECIYF